MLVREVMTTSPVTVRPGATVQAALRLVAEAHVTSLPVVNAAGRLRGIVSEADRIKDRVPSDPRLNDLAHPDEVDDVGAVDQARAAATTVPGVTSVRILAG